KGADLCLWSCAERPLEIAPQNGALERLVTLRHPGTHAIKLVAVKGSQTVEKSVTVQVLPPPAGMVVGMVSVTHEAVHIDRHERIHTVAVGFPPKESGNTYKFVVERQVSPGYLIKEAHFTKAPTDKRVSNVALKIAPDGQKVVITGDMTRPATFLHRT